MINRSNIDIFSDRRKLLLLGWLCISSMMSLALLAARIVYTGGFNYRFLAWNLFLAWIPLFAALLVWRLDQGRRKFWLPVALLSLTWLLFFPNAPYIVTDFQHLTPRQNVPLWFDLVMILSFAWNGLTVGFVSLRIMQQFAQRHTGPIGGWILAIGTLTISGFGIYIGRFLRWNTWDIVTNPHPLLQDILVRMVDPFGYPRTIGVTVLYSSFLILAYVTLWLFTTTNWHGHRGER
jgi:uncharacterized membrane protein